MTRRMFLAALPWLLTWVFISRKASPKTHIVFPDCKVDRIDVFKNQYGKLVYAVYYFGQDRPEISGGLREPNQITSDKIQRDVTKLERPPSA